MLYQRCSYSRSSNFIRPIVFRSVLTSAKTRKRQSDLRPQNRSIEGGVDVSQLELRSCPVPISILYCGAYDGRPPFLANPRRLSVRGNRSGGMPTVIEIPTTTAADGAAGTDDVDDSDTIASNPGRIRSSEVLNLQY